MQAVLHSLIGLCRSKVKDEKDEEAEVDADIDHMLDLSSTTTTEIPFDSIMDDSEEEVTDLLVEE